MKERSEEKGEGRPEGAEDGTPNGISRRSFLQGVGVAAGAATVPLGFSAQGATADGAIGPGATSLKLKINGEIKTVGVEPRTTLAAALRDELDLTGTKLVCDRGSCGACTVMVDGDSVCSCMMWAVDAQGKEITTIEGLAKPDGTLDPVQQAFIDHDGQQCGYCTPGFIMRSRAFLNENSNPSLEEIKTGLAGNICRCGTYTHVLAAVQQAAGKEA